MSDYLDNPNWKALGRCGEVDPEAFFPGPHQSAKPAKSVCARCEVQEICRDYARRMGEDGIWGGETRWEREVFWGWQHTVREK